MLVSVPQTQFAKIEAQENQEFFLLIDSEIGKDDLIQFRGEGDDRALGMDRTIWAVCVDWEKGNLPNLPNSRLVRCRKFNILDLRNKVKEITQFLVDQNFFTNQQFPQNLTTGEEHHFLIGCTLPSFGSIPKVDLFIDRYRLAYFSEACGLLYPVLQVLGYRDVLLHPDLLQSKLSEPDFYDPEKVEGQPQLIFGLNPSTFELQLKIEVYDGRPDLPAERFKITVTQEEMVTVLKDLQEQKINLYEA